jgi:hypothetical protein
MSVGLGCGDDSQSNPNAQLTLEDLRGFRGYPVYSVGSRFEEMPLTHVQVTHSPASRSLAPGTGYPTPDPMNPDLTTVSYGTCKPPDTDEGGCPLPLSITSSSYCARPVEMGVFDGEGLFTYRGATAGWASGGLVLFFRDSVVNIISTAKDYRDVEMRVADHMLAENSSAVQGARTSASEDFGPVTATCAA